MLLSSVFYSYGQLSPGDIAFVQYNADGTDNFGFVALVDIADTEVIHFTDNEENDLSGGEGTISWTPPSGGLTCGTVVTITTSPSASTGSVSETGDVNFSVNGDSILAYQGATGSPTFIAALSNDGGSWGGAADGNLPAGLTNGVNAIAISTEVDNCALDVANPETDTQANLLATINDNNNWTLRSNTTQQTFSDSFVVTNCSTDTRVEFINVTSSLVEGTGVFIDICVNIVNPSGSAATTVDVILGGGSSATNGTDYDDGAGTPMPITFPQTLTFPTGSSANQCLTIYMSTNDLIYEGDETVVLNLTNPTGGIAATVGGNSQHTLTIVDDETPVLADVIITEIMYNTIGGDDEWIEICNLSGVDQILNNYTIEVNGNPQYTFPSSGVTILDGDCILVELGDNGDANFNPGCVFTTIYSSGSGSGILGNSDGTITIVADDVSSTIIDSVSYDDVDGADGNGFSLHFNTNASDNSNTGTDWQEVSDAGSPGINSLISQCGTPAADINVANNSFNTIPDTSTASTVPYNTVFAATPIGSTTMPKTYYITNEGNIDLVINSISLDTDTNFSLQNLPTLPLTITPTDPPVAFEIVFNPQNPIGIKTDIVRIVNSDLDAENPYTFQIRGEAECAASAISISPASGPAGTIVTVIGTNLSTASATFNGTPAALISNISSTEMEVTVPSGVLSGSLEVLDDSGCLVTTPFTIIDNQIGSCEGGSTLTELFISEITDATYGSLTYIEIYNPTSSNINLSTYEIRIYSNGTDGTEIPTSSANPAPSVQQLSGTINAGQTFVLTTGTFGALGSTLCSVAGGDGSYGDQNSSTIAGVNVTSSGHDFIGLYNVGDAITDPPIDAFGVYGDDDWMDSLGTPITGTRGFDFRRLNTATPLPNATFNENQWNIIDWAGQGSTACVSNNDYSDIGDYDFSTGVPPTNIMGASSTVTFCDVTATITVSGDEGTVGGLPLAYQWFVFAPGDPMGWVAVTNNATYSGSTSDTLTISNTFGLDNYQYYCQIRENTITCYSASDAIRLITQSTTWVSPGVWSNGTPDINTTTIVDFNYDTTVNGSFSACSLNINSGTLNIRNGNYVEINGDLIVNGTLDIENEGSLVMIDDSGTVTNNGTTNVHKTTTDMETYDYTYWSSPVDYSVSGTSAQTVLTGFRSDRIYSFNTSQFSDLDADSFDDNQNAWTNHNTFMSAGRGYAAMTSGSGVHQRSITFNGTLNTGVISVPIALSQNGADANDDWNLLGNPYPSAIFVDELVSHNTNLSGTVYLWSHEDDISISNPGPNAYNFRSNDYAMYNSVGGIGTASTGDIISNIPTGYIASGQGFFIDAISAGTIEFTNAMRDRTYNNNDFFRNSESNSFTYPEKNRMWLNMTNPDGVFSQILIGYMEDGTLSKDRLYDGIRLEGSNFIDFYSKDNTNLYKYGIQGRPPFNIEDIVPIGYDSNILGELTISLYGTEGVLNDVTVYLKDNLLNSIHNLTNSDYIFSTETGNFEDRFEIVFQSESLSITDDKISSNELTIIELENGSVKFSVGNNLTIKTIEIIDLIGRTLYNLNGNSSTETFELPSLSQTAYIAKVYLSNGQTIIKRSIKRK